MNATGKEEDGMTGSLALKAETARTEPNYSKTAAMLLAACREFYGKPENEQAYTEWKKNGQNKKER